MDKLGASIQRSSRVVAYPSITARLIDTVNGLQWACTGDCASLELSQDRSMFSPAGRIGNGKRRLDRKSDGRRLELESSTLADISGLIPRNSHKCRGSRELRPLATEPSLVPGHS